MAHQWNTSDQIEVAGPDAIPMSAMSEELVNPTMVDLTVLDSASEVGDHVFPRSSGDCGSWARKPQRRILGLPTDSALWTVTATLTPVTIRGRAFSESETVFARP